MKKINLNQPILNVKGQPVSAPELDSKGQPIIVKGERKIRPLCVRDYFLTILGTKFTLIDNKEIFWTSALGILFSDTKKKEVEISDDKAKFLKRIIEDNKIKQPTPMGEKETQLFFPFEQAQLLEILMTEKEKEEVK